MNKLKFQYIPKRLFCGGQRSISKVFTKDLCLALVNLCGFITPTELIVRCLFFALMFAKNTNLEIYFYKNANI